MMSTGAAPDSPIVVEPLRVLIVEDRPSDAELMVLRLEQEGFDLQWVRVETEPEYVAALDAAPDIVLSDWNLPAFSGLRALRLVRGRGDDDTPFVIVSGAIGEEAAVEALQAGADDYVLKDRPARLGPAVRRALERKTLRDEQRRADAKLRQAAMVFENSGEAVMITDANGSMVAVNRAFVEITGYSEEEVLGRNPRMLQSGRQDRSFYRDMWAALATKGLWRGEVWNRRKSGAVYPEFMTIAAVKDEHGRTSHYVSVGGDLSSAREVQQKLDFLVHHDALTGLPNRILLHDRLEQVIRRAEEASSVVGLIVIDLDRFGKVNDGLGQNAGDELLRSVGHRLSGLIESADTVARIGGDDFAIVVEDGRNAVHLAGVAQGLQDSLALPFPISGQDVVIGSTLGISIYPADGTDAAVLLRSADVVLREAKARAPGSFFFANAELTAALEGRLELERALWGAVGRDELVVHYQPQVDMADRSLVGAEALVRWQHPQRGLVPPGEFIPLAEEMGFIRALGEWVMAESCRQVAEWQRDGFIVPRVSVNLSAQQMDDADLVAKVTAALDAVDIATERLELEVTESTIMRDSKVASAVLAGLREHGTDLALDDFGTGYSSLAQLRSLPLRRLKIDVSFVRDIGRDPAAEAIIRAIIAMASSLGLETVAEGVEREDQHVFLHDAGCDIGQGYLYGRPVPADALLGAWR